MATNIENAVGAVVGGTSNVTVQYGGLVGGRRVFYITFTNT